MTIDVVFDANVLYSASLRDLLMNLTLAKIVHAHWTDRIHEEWIRSLLRDRPDLKRESLERARDAMNGSVRDCLVHGYEELIETLHLPDPDDRHVLAAAIRSQSSFIVTRNLKDFPADALAPYKIKAVSPDDFVFGLLVANPGKVLPVIKSHREKLKNPPKTVDQHLDTLRRQGMHKTVAFLDEHRTEI